MGRTGVVYLLGLVLVLLFLYNVTESALLFASCSDTDTCGDANAECTFRSCNRWICLCNNETFMHWDDASASLSCRKPKDYQDACDSANDTCNRHNGLCIRGRCECGNGDSISQNGKQCFRKYHQRLQQEYAALGDSCGDGVNCKDSELECINGTCVCGNNRREATPEELAAYPFAEERCSLQTFMLYSVDGCTLEVQNVTGACDFNVDCPANASCINRTCNCNTGFEKSDDLTRCQQVAYRVGDVCDMNANLPGNSSCQWQNCMTKIVVCDEGFTPTEDYSSCFPRRRLDDSCDERNLCDQYGVNCENANCRCGRRFRPSNNGDPCVPYVTAPYKGYCNEDGRRRTYCALTMMCVNNECVCNSGTVPHTDSFRRSVRMFDFEYCVDSSLSWLNDTEYQSQCLSTTQTFSDTGSTSSPNMTSDSTTAAEMSSSSDSTVSVSSTTGIPSTSPDSTSSTMGQTTLTDSSTMGSDSTTITTASTSFSVTSPSVSTTAAETTSSPDSTVSVSSTTGIPSTSPDSTSSTMGQTTLTDSSTMGSDSTTMGTASTSFSDTSPPVSTTASETTSSSDSTVSVSSTTGIPSTSPDSTSSTMGQSTLTDSSTMGSDSTTMGTASTSFSDTSPPVSTTAAETTSSSDSTVSVSSTTGIPSTSPDSTSSTMGQTTLTDSSTMGSDSTTMGTASTSFSDTSPPVSTTAAETTSSSDSTVSVSSTTGIPSTSPDSTSSTMGQTTSTDSSTMGSKSTTTEASIKPSDSTFSDSTTPVVATNTPDSSPTSVSESSSTYISTDSTVTGGPSSSTDTSILDSTTTDASTGSSDSTVPETTSPDNASQSSQSPSTDGSSTGSDSTPMETSTGSSDSSTAANTTTETPPGNVGDECRSDMPCGTNMHCREADCTAQENNISRCVCNTGYTSLDRNTCTEVRSLTQNCTESTTCVGSQSVCTGSSLCGCDAAARYDNNTYCLTISTYFTLYGLGEECTVEADRTFNNFPWKLCAQFGGTECTGTCQCKSGFKPTLEVDRLNAGKKIVYCMEENLEHGYIPRPPCSSSLPLVADERPEYEIRLEEVLKQAATEKAEAERQRTKLIIGACLGGVGLFIVLATIVTMVRKSRRRKRMEDVDTSSTATGNSTITLFNGQNSWSKSRNTDPFTY